MSHRRIESEAREVASKQRKPRNVLTDPSPDIAPDVLVGILKSGRVSGYAKGTAHKGTFYIECEGVHQYEDESFLRVVMYGDESHDRETRIPLSMLASAGFIDTRTAALIDAASKERGGDALELPQPIGYVQKQPLLTYAQFWIGFAVKPESENGHEPVALYSEDQVRAAIATTKAAK